MPTWRERVAEWEAGREITTEEIALAKSFRTCAVGEQHQKHPDVVVYGGGGGPDDEELFQLGGGYGALEGFLGAVRLHDAHKAGRYLDAIEDRVLALKREMPDVR
jgi:hypothetical protein